MPNYTEFGAEARKVMLLKGVTMTELAKEIGISTNYLSDIFKGARAGTKYLSQISKILEMEEFSNEQFNNFKS
ncbi:helix-turn-helix transcriptional regulator [Bacillaceae bacterium Marseille-Q3522]|nr:helix-turn-helix transcriptional regulator [Bacillaceae bacterium Marseille-Q3522]